MDFRLISRLTTISLLCISLQFSGSIDNTMCEHRQYLELGKSGIISCSFQEGFFGVFWFNTTNYRSEEPILHFTQSSKTGVGYTSGEYDVLENGSLVIINVTFQHETSFTVAYFQSQRDAALYYDVKVVVLVKPRIPFPVINDCTNEEKLCFQELTSGSSIVCSVNDTRPSVRLKWLLRTVEGDIDVKFLAKNSSFNEIHSSSASIIDLHKYSSNIVLFVCKALGPVKILNRNYSLVLVEGYRKIQRVQKPHFTFVEKNSILKLTCTNHDIGFLAWKKMSDSTKGSESVLLCAAFIRDNRSYSNIEDIILGNKGSLMVPNVQLKDEGIYSCIHGDGFSSNTTFHQVVIYVTPVPPYPVVKGCKYQENCILNVTREGNLTCALYGIRPDVTLKWQLLDGSDAINFIHQELTTKSRGELFDVTLEATYRVDSVQGNKFPIECIAPESKMYPFTLSTKIDLWIEKELSTSDGITIHSKHLFWIIPSIIMIVVLTAITVVCCRKRTYTERKKTSKTRATEAEKMPLNASEHSNLTGKTDEFLTQIKEKYGDIYNDVKPVPYMTDNRKCVEQLFVQGGIEVLDKNSVAGKPSKWEKLDSYHDILRITGSKRCILEGEPGYGKTIITIQFAYDWCNKNQLSTLKDVDVLILLRLRQLGGITSINKAIKEFLLPKDTKITEEDIARIIKDSKRVVILLDGYDEYPDRDNTLSTDINSIIVRDMFRDIEVLLTTRSSVLPLNYSPKATRIRLTGFDKNNRTSYIRKAVVGDDDKEVQKVQDSLHQNPILESFCHVPSFFVVLSHMVKDSSKDFINLNSVTSLFRILISSFYSHMMNKRHQGNVHQLALEENERGALGKLAFTALREGTHKGVWTKSNLLKDLKKEHYDQFIDTGILVEEEVINIPEDPNIIVTDISCRKIVVKFYHKHFCEWYAAKHLSEILRSAACIDEALKDLDSFKLGYLYRFTCGLNPDLSDKIIEHLLKIRGAERIAVLCMFERYQLTQTCEQTDLLIRNLCHTGVLISNYESVMLQSFSLEIIGIATTYRKLIRAVRLFNCFKAVDLPSRSILMRSGLSLNSKLSAKVLVLWMADRPFTEEEFGDVIEFSSMCSSLQELAFSKSVLPFSIKITPAFWALKNRNFEVGWYVSEDKKRQFFLNLDSGRWQNKCDNSELNMAKHKKLVSSLQKDFKGWTEDMYKEHVEKYRELSRQWVAKHPLTEETEVQGPLQLNS